MSVKIQIGENGRRKMTSSLLALTMSALVGPRLVQS